MPGRTDQLYCKSVEEWRRWLESHHDKTDGIWLLFDRKGTSRQTLDYGEALDEALCYGWIDSLIKKIDDKRYARKFTPRNVKSNWSEANKERVGKLIKNRRMKEKGYEVIEAAKANGWWDKPDRPPLQPGMPKELEAALTGNVKALKNFSQLAPSFQRQYILWISAAKRQETRDRRVREAMELLEKGEKLGLR